MVVILIRQQVTLKIKYINQHRVYLLSKLMEIPVQIIE